MVSTRGLSQQANSGILNIETVAERSTKPAVTSRGPLDVQ